jgi:ATP-dependent RNA helicase DHX29
VTPDDDLTSAYVHLKMRISELTTYRRPDESADATFLRMLQQRLEEVKQDYLFDEREAENAYRAERKKADQATLQARLRGEIIAAPLKTPRVRSPQRMLSVDAPAETGSAEDVFDGNSDDDSPGGMFQLLEEMPQTETTAQGIVIGIRDMPLPKNWSGKTPRTLLLEVVHKSDKYGNVSFRSISRESRAKRSSVRVIWHHGRTNEWSMENVACYDNGQAEQYIATVALHSLSFPITEGFVVGGTASANNRTSFRLLPSVYRDLWDELEEKRRRDHDSINRGIWAKLQNILEPKIAGAKVWLV